MADKPDSQQICFIPDDDYRRFLKERICQEPGELVTADGRVLGQHRGIAYYTIGQRHGLGIASPDRLYVTHIDREANRVVVGPEEALYAEEAEVEDVHFVQEHVTLPLEVEAKYRYRSPRSPAVLLRDVNGVRVRFQTPQRALTPGQAVVFYRGEDVAGGGRIASVGAARQAEELYSGV